jgi:hypothetical protein
MNNPFAASEGDAIKGGALNLTLFSGLSAAIATAIVVFNESFEAIFGDGLTGAELACRTPGMLLYRFIVGTEN